jgi:hypothetical protein
MRSVEIATLVVREQIELAVLFGSPILPDCFNQPAPPVN